MRMRRAAIAALVSAAALTAGCTVAVVGSPVPVAGRSAGASTPAPVKPLMRSTVTVTRRTAAPVVRSNITAALVDVQRFVTGSVWTAGKSPSPTGFVAVSGDDGQFAGTLAFSESAGASHYSLTQAVSVSGIGSSETLALTVRGSSSNPRTIVDVLHHPTNPTHDYLLTGEAFRAVAPTPWVTVPAEFGNGIDCVLPGRSTVCEVVTDLLANQKLNPQLPTNKATKAPGTTTITSAITVRQLLGLGVWRLRNATGTAVIRRATKAELDLALVPVTIVYRTAAGRPKGKPNSMTIKGQVTVAGSPVSIDLAWAEQPLVRIKDGTLPVPTKALYTVLDAGQAKQLAALQRQSE